MVGLSGRGRECVCCGARWRRFAEFNGRADSLCLRCGSLERHRALAIYLREAGLPGSADEVLHFAPEVSVSRHLAAAPGGYVSTDLKPGAATVAADITALPFEDGRFGLVVCSHVLEHVPGERAALAELRRVCAGDGLVLVMVPRDLSLETTDEDPSVTDPAERRRRFLQEDHVRLYGRDLEARLDAAGFDVTAATPAVEQGPERALLFGLRPEDEVFSCRPA
jgi:SAM-dependent methyltransferase